MANYELNIGRNKYDDLFNTDESRKTEEIKPVKLSELKPYEQQPFKVLLDESMNELVESIQQSGILTPIVYDRALSMHNNEYIKLLIQQW